MRAPSILWMEPELVIVPAGKFKYRPAGEFHQNRQIVDAPLQTRVVSTHIEIMKNLVSVSDYKLCVSAGVCNKVLTEGTQEMPQTGVSFLDAKIYAEWISSITNQMWRLPTDEEWTRIAAERFVDTLGIVSSDPAQRWLEEYRRNTNANKDTSVELRPLGGYGENSLGVLDMAGPIWEWTKTCLLRGEVSEVGPRLKVESKYCGVRLVEGRHRAFIIDFVRDASVGGCSAGLPPDYLGFRLVREIN